MGVFIEEEGNPKSWDKILVIGAVTTIIVSAIVFGVLALIKVENTRQELKPLDHKFVVNKVTTYNEHYSTYELYSIHRYVNGGEKLDVVDTTGKFKVTDTLELQIVTK